MRRSGWLWLLGGTVVVGGVAWVVLSDEDDKAWKLPTPPKPTPDAEPGPEAGPEPGPEPGVEPEPEPPPGPDEPPPEALLPPVPEPSWPPNMRELEPGMFEVLDRVIEGNGKATSDFHTSIVVGYSGGWRRRLEVLDQLETLAALNPSIMFWLFRFRDSFRAIGKPTENFAYVATAVDVDGDPRVPLFSFDRDEAPTGGQWRELLDFAVSDSKAAQFTPVPEPAVPPGPVGQRQRAGRERRRAEPGRTRGGRQRRTDPMDQFEEGAVSRREGDFSVVVEPIKEYIVDHWEYSVLWYVWRGSVGTKDEALRKGRAMNEAQAIGEARTFIMRQ